MWRHFLFIGLDLCHLFPLLAVKKKKGRGLWLIKDENIRIIALTDTIDATYNIDNGILTLTTSEKETDEFYGFTSIVKYRNK